MVERASFGDNHGIVEQGRVHKLLALVLAITAVGLGACSGGSDAGAPAPATARELAQKLSDAHYCSKPSAVRDLKPVFKSGSAYECGRVAVWSGSSKPMLDAAIAAIRRTVCG